MKCQVTDFKDSNHYTADLFPLENMKFGDGTNTWENQYANTFTDQTKIDVSFTK